MNWERYDAAIEKLFIHTPVSNPAADSLLESLMTIMMRQCEFIKELGIQEHVEQESFIK